MEPAGPDLLRLFVAVWPGPRARRELARWMSAWTWPPSASTVAAARLHLTLAFIGPIEAVRVPGLIERLQLPFAPFQLDSGSAQRWPGGLAVLRLHRVPAELTDLQERIARAIETSGIRIDGRPFVPHVTLARRAPDAIAPPGTLHLDWPVRRFALVRSDAGRYTEVASFACNEAGGSTPPCSR